MIAARENDLSSYKFYKLHPKRKKESEGDEEGRKHTEHNKKFTNSLVFLNFEMGVQCHCRSTCP